MPANPLTSSEQWAMNIHSVIPSINWNFHNQGIVVLDNDDVWAYFHRDQDFIADYEGDYYNLYKVSPEGCIRYTPSSWSADDGQTLNWRPYGDQFFVYEQDITWGGEASWVVTDGKLMWIYHDVTKQLFEFDPETLVLTHVAGEKCENFSCPGALNSHDGLSARFTNYEINPTYYDGYIYFGETFTGTNHQYIRRVKTTAPYTVEAFAFNAAPAGYTDGNWFASINPATGLPNSLNDDALISRVRIAFYEDYMYLFTSSPFNGLFPSDWALRRAPISNPSQVELLHYGLTDNLGLENTQPVNLDHVMGYSETPNGVWDGFTWAAETPEKGTPDLEGFSPTLYSGVVLSDGRWVLDNYSGGFFSSGYNQFQGRLVTWDLPEIVSRFDEQGSIRHDRSAPLFKTIINGTSFGESSSLWNFNVRDRLWQFRAGDTPLVPHPMVPGIGHNPNSSYGDALFFIGVVIDNSLYYENFVGAQGGLVCILEENTVDASSVFKVNLIFEGQSLKGYSDSVKLDAPYAQDRIILS